MAFASLQFLAFCLGSVAVLRLVPLGRWHVAALLALSLLFVSTFATGLLALIPLMGFALAGYAGLLLAARFGLGAGGAALITAFVLLFGWLRHYALLGFIPPLPLSYVAVGMSYILFRVLHLMVDVAEGALRAPSLLRYLAYIFSFLTFVSGPIQRYEDHEAQMSARLPIDGARFHLALGRMLLGYLMISVFSVFTAKVLSKAEPQFYSAVAAGFHPGALAFYLATALTYFAHLYFNFVGYMHIVIGVGLLAGFTLPENFNQPLKSENFLDLWARWHMTLGNWFKLYVFNPAMKLLSASGPRPAAVPYLGAVAYFLTFFLLGLWHGSTVIFLLYGLLLAGGATVNKLWQNALAARFGRAGYRSLKEKGWYRLASRAITLAYFVLALTCLWADDAHLRLLLSPAGLMVLVVGLVGMSLLALPLLPISDAFYALMGRLTTSRLFSSDLARGAWSASLIFLLFYAVMQLNASAPDFIYKGF